MDGRWVVDMTSLRNGYTVPVEENEEVKELMENMDNFFGHEIPSPINFPITFKYYLKMYREYTKEIG